MKQAPHREIPLNERIIFALDVDSVDEAKHWVERLGSRIGFYKVGLQLFIAGWFHVIDMITERGHKVMCDLKLFDIPETVRLAVRQLRGRGITFATVHGNPAILQAAAAEKADVGILAVTELTSLGEADHQEMGYAGAVEDLVCLRARWALEAGCDGVVCSGREVRRIRQDLGGGLRIVTPGIRPGEGAGSRRDDQKRTTSAREAISNGADHLVVGRPIREAADPRRMVESLRAEIQLGLSS